MSEIAIEQQDISKPVLGFWIYIMTDCILFASLFATYAVLFRNTGTGPGGFQLFDLKNVLAETLILLTSSFTCGLAMLSAHKNERNKTMMWFMVTFLLGIVFLTLELREFNHFVAMGDSWRRSGFLSAFYTLVGTHGLHISVGLTWMATMMWQMARKGLSKSSIKRLTLLSMFWHFLDIVWIFIFTIVYLRGAIAP
jgi:cytochrome o ubiquinol oxidase subunit 3